MRVLVTGGSGFLGAWIMRRLLRKDISVRAFDLRADTRLLEALAPEQAATAQWASGDNPEMEAALAQAIEIEPNEAIDIRVTLLLGR